MGGLKPLHEQVIMTPDRVKPSSSDMEVLGVFNPGGALYNGETYLLARVMERSNEKWEGHFPAPRAVHTRDGSYRVELDWLREGMDATKADDHAVEIIGEEETIRPLHISHFRRMVSKDGIDFGISDKPDFSPWMPYEKYGIEDPSITSFRGDGIEIEGQHYRYLNAYVACSPEYEISTAFAVTNDFGEFKRLPPGKPKPIFTVNNKDTVLFPRRIKNPWMGGEEYAATPRPTGSTRYMVPSIFFFTSPDLYHWEDHGTLIRGTEKGHVGINTPPIELEDGWLIIYHQHRHRNNLKEYIVSAALLHRDIFLFDGSGGLVLDEEGKPRVNMLKKMDVFMDPHMDAQKSGVVKNVVFPGAAILHENDYTLYVYAGGADRVTTVHMYRMSSIMDNMKPVQI